MPTVKSPVEFVKVAFYPPFDHRHDDLRLRVKAARQFDFLNAPPA
jgi:hypothetical protein